MGFKVEGVTEANLTSDSLLHACCSIHGGGWLGLSIGPLMLAAAYCGSFKPGAKLEFHAGWSGWTRPPTIGGEGGRGGSPGANRSAKGGAGGF